MCTEWRPPYCIHKSLKKNSKGQSSLSGNRLSIATLIRFIIGMLLVVALGLLYKRPQGRPFTLTTSLQQHVRQYHMSVKPLKWHLLVSTVKGVWRYRAVNFANPVVAEHVTSSRLVPILSVGNWWQHLSAIWQQSSASHSSSTCLTTSPKLWWEKGRPETFANPLFRDENPSEQPSATLWSISTY